MYNALLFHHTDHFYQFTVQQAILLGVGLQHKSIEELQNELNLNSQQILAIFNRIMRKFVTVCFKSVCNAYYSNAI